MPHLSKICYESLVIGLTVGIDWHISLSLSYSMVCSGEMTDERCYHCDKVMACLTDPVVLFLLAWTAPCILGQPHFKPAGATTSANTVNADVSHGPCNTPQNILPLLQRYTCSVFGILISFRHRYVFLCAATGCCMIASCRATSRAGNVHKRSLVDGSFDVGFVTEFQYHWNVCYTALS